MVAVDGGLAEVDWSLDNPSRDNGLARRRGVGSRRGQGRGQLLGRGFSRMGREARRGRGESGVRSDGLVPGRLVLWRVVEAGRGARKLPQGIRKGIRRRRRWRLRWGWERVSDRRRAIGNRQPVSAPRAQGRVGVWKGGHWGLGYWGVRRRRDWQHSSSFKTATMGSPRTSASP